MGKYQRRKGKRNEWLLRKILKEYGIEVENASLEGYDVRVCGIWKGEVKSGKQVPKWLYDKLGENEFLFCKRDRREWLVVMPLEFFLEKFT